MELYFAFIHCNAKVVSRCWPGFRSSQVKWMFGRNCRAEPLVKMSVYSVNKAFSAGIFYLKLSYQFYFSFEWSQHSGATQSVIRLLMKKGGKKAAATAYCYAAMKRSRQLCTSHSTCALISMAILMQSMECHNFDWNSFELHCVWFERKFHYNSNWI